MKLWARWKLFKGLSLFFYLIWRVILNLFISKIRMMQNINLGPVFSSHNWTMNMFYRFKKVFKLAYQLFFIPFQTFFNILLYCRLCFLLIHPSRCSRRRLTLLLTRPLLHFLDYLLSVIIGSRGVQGLSSGGCWRLPLRFFLFWLRFDFREQNVIHNTSMMSQTISF